MSGAAVKDEEIERLAREAEFVLADASGSRPTTHTCRQVARWAHAESVRRAIEELEALPCVWPPAHQCGTDYNRTNPCHRCARLAALKAESEG
jgi:hypothetical protein